jgi:hypothetical protein
MNGSSFSPKLSMVIPNAHRAITSMVNALKFLYRTLNNYCLDYKPRWKSCVTFWHPISLHSQLSFEICLPAGWHTLLSSLTSVNREDDNNWLSKVYRKRLCFIISSYTSLILPVVKMGVTDERTSFHSLSWIILNILRKTLRLTAKLCENIQSISEVSFVCLEKKEKKSYWTHSAINEMVEIFDENWFDEVNVSRVKVRQSSIKITKGFPVLCSHFLVILWKVLQNNSFVPYTRVWEKHF